MSRYQISVLMADSCAESHCNSFDAHHEAVGVMGPKSPLVSACDPGFLHDARVKIILNSLFSSPVNKLLNDVLNVELGQAA